MKDMSAKLHKLIGIIEQKYPPLPRLVGRSLLQGLFTALGATVGLSFFLTLVTLLLHNFTDIPAIEWLLTQLQRR